MKNYAGTAKELAEIWGVSVPTMYKLMRREGFPAVRVGRRWVIPIDQANRWLEAEAAKGIREAR